MLWVLILICIVKHTWGDDGEVDSLIVSTKQGRIRGYKSPEGDFYVFYGVPYATAPTGWQRFQAPLPPPMWQGTFEAYDRKIVCPQYRRTRPFIKSDSQEKEDCLIANIYGLQTEKRKLPVLVYVHGGGFAIGYGDFRTSKHLAMSKRAIIVNFNYRLGAHGFLCLGTKNVPGNAGMKDQVALLRWVKDNIAGFGGNPVDVTLAGYSAGSSSVDLLMLSKMGNGLFNKVIPESGANTAIFSIQMDPIKCAKSYAKELNIDNVDDIHALEEFYLTAPYDLITSISMFDKINCTFAFTPYIEHDVGVERFLEDSPVNILKSGNNEKLPMLYGINRMEGMIRLHSFEAWSSMMNIKFSDFLPTDLQFQSKDDNEKVSAEVKKLWQRTSQQRFYYGLH